MFGNFKISKYNIFSEYHLFSFDTYHKFLFNTKVANFVLNVLILSLVGWLSFVTYDNAFKIKSEKIPVQCIDIFDNGIVDFNYINAIEDINGKYAKECTLLYNKLNEIAKDQTLSSKHQSYLNLDKRLEDLKAKQANIESKYSKSVFNKLFKNTENNKLFGSTVPEQIIDLIEYREYMSEIAKLKENKSQLDDPTKHHLVEELNTLIKDNKANVISEYKNEKLYNVFVHALIINGIIITIFVMAVVIIANSQQSPITGLYKLLLNNVVLLCVLSFVENITLLLYFLYPLLIPVWLATIIYNNLSLIYIILFISLIVLSSVIVFYIQKLTFSKEVLVRRRINSGECFKCGTHLFESDKFCPTCKTQVRDICPRCNTLKLSYTNHCSHCGA